MVHGNLLNTCPLTMHNIYAAIHIFGPNLASIRGKIKNQSFEKVVMNFVAMPTWIQELNSNVTLCWDMFLLMG